MGKLFGDGIFNVDGDSWRVQRQNALALVNFNKLIAFVPVFAEEAKVMASVLDEYASSGKSFNAQQLFMSYPTTFFASIFDIESLIF